jgi:hypothetical protein
MEEPKSKFYTVKGEIEDLESLLPDLHRKIAVNINLENQEMKNATRKKRNPKIRDLFLFTALRQCFSYATLSARKNVCCQ